MAFSRNPLNKPTMCFIFLISFEELLVANIYDYQIEKHI